MDKPIALRIQEFQQNISKVIGESGLSIFFIKYILKDLQAEIDTLSEQFAVDEINEYRRSLQNEQKDEEEQN